MALRAEEAVAVGTLAAEVAAEMAAATFSAGAGLGVAEPAAVPPATRLSKFLALFRVASNVEC